MESTPPEEVYVDEFDPKEHQGCYIFTPDGEEDRPTKRRKTKGKQRAAEKTAIVEEKCPFPVLLDGKETESTLRLRYRTYCKLWEAQEKRTKAILDSFNSKTLDDVSAFVKDATPEKYEGKIPTALVLAGPNIASHELLFQQLAQRIRNQDKTGPVVALASKDATNLKTTLRKLIRDATQQDEGVDDEEEDIIRKSTKLLNYDLQILQTWCESHEGQKVTIAIQDSEAFDSNILSDLISLFSSYLDRIPFVLLVGIATSVEIFHDKLPKSTIRLMRGNKFDVERAEECLAQIFNDSMTSDKAVLRLGATVCDFLLERYRDHTQSIQAFVAALKYAYMSHFYANPLSIILGFIDNADGLGEVLSAEHVEAVRNVPSFRRYVEGKMAAKEVGEVRKLLTDDNYVRRTVAEKILESRNYGIELGQALAFLEIGRSCTLIQNKTPRYELYAKALSGELQTSPSVRDFLMSLKRMNSTTLLNLLEKVMQEVQAPAITEPLRPLQEKIKKLVEEAEASGGKKNLISEFDTTNNTLRGTAVSKKVRLGEQKSSLTKQDTEYSALVQQVYTISESYLTTNFNSSQHGLQNVLLHEILFYDLRSPHSAVFAPRPRSTIERGLSQPQDYLACSCCTSADGEEVGIRGTQPPTSIIYQLYLESGALINIYDLWSAFYSVIAGDEEDFDVPTAQALFYKSLAEMRFLGFVKHTKKKTDHIAKLAWKGI
ncbi:origin recognition complex subunit 3 N-terminus-domain-containing protein [Tuber borchii]|uniref:Origin recognition complex subunit 3 n=1 Tax=Tuber borchii TaxID=42251 RepID=A0A2T7A0D5_TUBBO|nr:origin recognition complex subunit 3 N-terminus-domain-containing protein [Tuber borchii]